MKLCVIPARGGSKRIPKKNIKEFLGKPMIAWSIDTALECKYFDRVIVSTDDNEIRAIAERHGAEVPFIRPSELANDMCGIIEVIQHAIEWFNNRKQHFEFVCCLFPVAPFTLSSSICRALDQMICTGSDYAFPVTTYPATIQRALRVRDDSRVEMFDPTMFTVRSQDVEQAFHDAGQFYWGSASAWLAGEIVFSEKATAVVLPRYRVMDIDTIDDWKQAELMFQLLEKFHKGIPEPVSTNI